VRLQLALLNQYLLRVGVNAKRLAVAVGLFILFIRRQDTVSVTDPSNLRVGKIQGDGARTADDLAAFQFSKGINDGAGLDDGNPYFAEDYVSENYTLDAGQIIRLFGKQLAHIASATSGAPVFAFTKVLGDSVRAIDDLLVTQVRDDAPVVSDTSVTSFDKMLGDASAAIGSGLLLMQSYMEDMTYFAEDYVGASRTF
jgi:hypothetical protein